MKNLSFQESRLLFVSIGFGFVLFPFLGILKFQSDYLSGVHPVKVSMSQVSPTHDFNDIQTAQFILQKAGVNINSEAGGFAYGTFSDCRKHDSPAICSRKTH